MKPRPNVPTAKPPIAMPLRHGDRRCQRPSASRSSVGQRLAAALLAQRAAGPQPEVEVVEDLGRLLVGHFTHCIACFGGDYAHPARLGPPFRGPRRPRPGACARPAWSSASAPELVIASGDLTHRGRRGPARAGGALPAPARPAGARRAREPRHPVHLPGPVHAARGASSSAQWETTEPRPRDRRRCTSSGSTRCGRGGTSRAASATRSSTASPSGSRQARAGRAAGRRAAPPADRRAVAHAEEAGRAPQPRARAPRRLRAPS